MRRCQILLASARGENAYQIAHQLGCNPQTARNAIHTFNEKGLPQALRQGSKRPHTVYRAFQGPEQAEALRELLHQKPRNFGKDTSLWTLEATRFSDNYFDLKPGEERTISVTNPRASLRPEAVEVRWR